MTNFFQWRSCDITNTRAAEAIAQGVDAVNRAISVFSSESGLPDDVGLLAPGPTLDIANASWCQTLPTGGQLVPGVHGFSLVPVNICTGMTGVPFPLPPMTINTLGEQPTLCVEFNTQPDECISVYMQRDGVLLGDPLPVLLRDNVQSFTILDTNGAYTNGAEASFDIVSGADLQVGDLIQYHNTVVRVIGVSGPTITVDPPVTLKTISPAPGAFDASQRTGVYFLCPSLAILPVSAIFCFGTLIPITSLNSLAVANIPGFNLPQVGDIITYGSFTALVVGTDDVSFIGIRQVALLPFGVIPPPLPFGLFRVVYRPDFSFTAGVFFDADQAQPNPAPIDTPLVPYQYITVGGNPSNFGNPTDTSLYVGQDLFLGSLTGTTLSTRVLNIEPGIDINGTADIFKARVTIGILGGSFIITPTLLNSALYRVTINGVNNDFTSDSSATEAEVLAGVITAIQTGSQSGVFTETGTFILTPSVINNTLYRVTINGVDNDYISDSSATLVEIISGLLAAIQAGPQAGVFTEVSTPTALNLVLDPSGPTPTISVNANLTLTTRLDLILNQNTSTPTVSVNASLTLTSSPIPLPSSIFNATTAAFAGIYFAFPTGLSEILSPENQPLTGNYTRLTRTYEINITDKVFQHIEDGSQTTRSGTIDPETATSAYNTLDQLLTRGGQTAGLTGFLERIRGPADTATSSSFNQFNGQLVRPSGANRLFAVNQLAKLGTSVANLDDARSQFANSELFLLDQIYTELSTTGIAAVRSTTQTVGSGFVVGCGTALPINPSPSCPPDQVSPTAEIEVASGLVTPGLPLRDGEHVTVYFAPGYRLAPITKTRLKNLGLTDTEITAILGLDFDGRVLVTYDVASTVIDDGVALVQALGPTGLQELLCEARITSIALGPLSEAQIDSMISQRGQAGIVQRPVGTIPGQPRVKDLTLPISHLLLEILRNPSTLITCDFEAALAHISDPAARSSIAAAFAVIDNAITTMEDFGRAGVQLLTDPNVDKVLQTIAGLIVAPTADPTLGCIFGSSNQSPEFKLGGLPGLPELDGFLRGLAIPMRARFNGFVLGLKSFGSLVCWVLDQIFKFITFNLRPVAPTFGEDVKRLIGCLPAFPDLTTPVPDLTIPGGTIDLASTLSAVDLAIATAMQCIADRFVAIQKLLGEVLNEIQEFINFLNQFGTGKVFRSTDSTNKTCSANPSFDDVMNQAGKALADILTPLEGVIAGATPVVETIASFLSTAATDAVG